MKVSELGRSAFCISIGAAAAMLTGCGGSQPPVGAPGAISQSPAIATRAGGGGSWMLPEATGEDLLYVSVLRRVSVYTYPEGKRVGELRGFYLPSGQCVDKAGNVYITDWRTSRVYKYAHGKSKRLQTYFVPNGIDCSIDPTSGDLAVASWAGEGIYIFKNATGAPLKYTDSHFYAYYSCGYDSKGNLFINGISQLGSNEVVFAELPHSGSELKPVALNQSFVWPAGIKWDGKNFTVADGGSPVVYQFALKDRRGTKVGTTELGSNAKYVHQYWIQGQTLLASTTCGGLCEGAKSGSGVLFFSYPSGGTATKIVTEPKETEGNSVSLAPR